MQNCLGSGRSSLQEKGNSQAIPRCPSLCLCLGHFSSLPSSSRRLTFKPGKRVFPGTITSVINRNESHLLCLWKTAQMASGTAQAAEAAVITGRRQWLGTEVQIEPDLLALISLRYRWCYHQRDKYGLTWAQAAIVSDKKYLCFTL